MASCVFAALSSVSGLAAVRLLPARFVWPGMPRNERGSAVSRCGSLFRVTQSAGSRGDELRKRLHDADRVRSLGNQDRKGPLHLQLGAMNLNQLAGGQLLLDTQARDITDSRSGGDHALDRLRAG